MDVFVKKEYRRQGITNEYFKKVKDIAREKGCSYLLGSVCTAANNANNSMKWMLSIGYEVSHTSGTMIFFTMQL